MNSSPWSLTVRLVDDPLLVGPLRSLAIRQLGVVSIAQLRENGVTRAVVRRRVESARWRSAARGVVDVGAAAPVELHPTLRLRRSTILGLVTMGPDAIAVGLSALSLYGVWGVSADVGPQVVKPDASARKRRAEVRCRRFHPGDQIVQLDGWRAVTPDRALAQAAVEVGPRSALALIDSALHRGVIGPQDLGRIRALTSRRRGSRSLASLWDLVDGRRESPLESWAYWDLHAAGLPPTDLQVTFRNSFGQVVARADIGYLLDDGTWLLIELDGREFHPAGQVVRDEQRDNALSLEAFGTVLRYRGEHLGVNGRMTREVGSALRSRGWSRQVA